MILPIGHDESATRRWPWVTFAIAGLCALVFLGTDASAPAPADPAEALAEASTYWREHAYLEAAPEIKRDVGYDVPPNQRSQYLALLRDQSYDDMPEDPAQVEAQQAQLDRLTARALSGPGLDEGTRPDHAYWRWGLVPGGAGVVTLLSHQFLHGGWLHLIGNLLLLLLIAPALEDRWGRPLFLAFYLVGGMAGGVTHLGMSEDPRPMIGASGAIAAVLGAFAVRFAQTQMRFAYFFFIGFRILRGTFEARAWVMLGVWFANELLQAWWTGASGLSDGVAYWAHVGGFACGAAGAFALGRSGIEARWIEPRLEAKTTLARGNPVVQQALEARERGELEASWALLEAEARRAPRDPDVQLAFWDAAAACGRAAEAAPGFARFVRGLAAGGELAQAARAWSELTGVVPDALADPVTLLKIFPALREGDDPEAARRALRHAVDPRATDVSAGTALRVVELARSFDPPTALRAARRALRFTEIDAAKRARVEALVAELEAQGVTEPAAAEEARPTAVARAHAGAGAGSAVPPERPALTVPLEVTLDPELATDPTREIARGRPAPPPLTLPALAGWSGLKLSEAVPLALREAGIVLQLSPERRVLLAWSRIQAVAVAGVRDLAAKPVLLFDLLLNWNDFASEEPLQGVRLRSDRFDARRLAPAAASQNDALRSLAASLLERGATPLPDAESARGRPFRVYDERAAYEREVLQIAG